MFITKYYDGFLVTFVQASAADVQKASKTTSIEKLIDNSTLDSTEKVKIKELVKKYNLKVADKGSIPANIEPGVAKNAKDIEALILKGQKITKELHANLSKTSNTTTTVAASDSNIIGPLSIAPFVSNGSYTSNTYIGYNYYLNLTAYYKYMNYPDYPDSNYFTEATGASSFLSGYHNLVGWTQTYATDWILGNGDGIHAECNGTWDTYTYVPGIGEVLVSSTPDSWSWERYWHPTN